MFLGTLARVYFVSVVYRRKSGKQQIYILTDFFLCKNIVEFRTVFSNQSELASFYKFLSFICAVIKTVNSFTLNPTTSWPTCYTTLHSYEFRNYC